VFERLGSRFKVQGSRFKVQGSRFKVRFKPGNCLGLLFPEYFMLIP
jgi:hypothetical protein